MLCCYTVAAVLIDLLGQTYISLPTRQSSAANQASVGIGATTFVAQGA